MERSSSSLRGQHWKDVAPEGGLVEETGYFGPRSERRG